MCLVWYRLIVSDASHVGLLVFDMYIKSNTKAFLKKKKKDKSLEFCHCKMKFEFPTILFF